MDACAHDMVSMKSRYWILRIKKKHIAKITYEVEDPT